MPQAFFYTFAFSHLKKKVSGDIFYALSAGNYGNLISGLYGWKLSLPVNGFVVPATPQLQCDAAGKCEVTDSIVPLEKRFHADPADPSNIERLENIFKANSLLLRSFVFPATVSEEEKAASCRELYKKYGIYADRDTSASYAAFLKRKEILADDGAAVLVSRDSPSLDEAFVRHNIGEVPQVNEEIKKASSPSFINRNPIKKDDEEALISILNSLNLRRIF